MNTSKCVVNYSKLSIALVLLEYSYIISFVSIKNMLWKSQMTLMII